MPTVIAALTRAARYTAVMVALCGLAYPLTATAIGAALFPFEAGGSIVRVDGRAVGSHLVAQPFASHRYLHGRPSSCAHDPRALAGSNLAPSNPALRDRAHRDAAAIAAREGIAPASVPPEMVAASGSCIDPHITPAAARIQAPRIARARGLDEAEVQRLIDAHIQGEGPLALGGPRLEVLAFNLALDPIIASP